MFEDEQPPAKKSTDYTGTLIGAMLLPVFFLFAYLGKAEIGFTVCLVLAMIMIAIKLRWRLRKYVWFWTTIALILLLHIPLFFIVRWPQTNIPTIFYSMPLGIMDFLLISGAIGLAEKLFLKGSSGNEEG
jgi:hypothetical protein